MMGREAMFSEPKVTLRNYISYFVSPWHVWFREIGYPELDLLRFEDGEWAIIQFLQAPIIPAETPWTYVLTKLRHVEISPWVCKKYAENLDLERRHVWDELERQERRAAEDKRADDLHCEDVSERMFKAIRGNDDLMNRIAKNGLGETSLPKLFRHVPKHHFRKDKKKCSPFTS